MHLLATLTAASWPLAAAELRVLPNTVTLQGPHTTQRVIVVRQENGKTIADLSPDAKFISADPKVASVDDTGVIRPVGDGETTVTATHEEQTATVKVKVTNSKADASPSYLNDVTPLMTKVGCNSGACHGALAGKGGLKLSLRGYNPAADHFVLTRQALGRRIDLQEPNRSLFLLKPTAAVTHGGGLKVEVDSDDYRLLSRWIASGAPGPKTNEATLQRLEVFPPEAVLKPKSRLQVLVRAVYSDGHTQDVTHWAKFNSTEELVATVDAEGHVRVAGYGETAVTVWYSNLVAVAHIASPYRNRLEPTVCSRKLPQRNNFVDDLVLKKLQALRLPPSPTCNDSEFIRRAYLDAAGILPTPEEVQKFLADKDPKKRSLLIDELLKRPEFVDYWSYKWSDLLLVSTRKLPQQAVWAFHEYIRRSVADNKPWDQFAREVVTASGSNLNNGAANYFVLHKDISELTEATSLTFLGTSITCARCHNHPLEKWTQDQYWGLANLFSRVKLKNGDRGGEVTVQAQPFGDVPHLRTGRPQPPAPLDAKLASPG